LQHEVAADGATAAVDGVESDRREVGHSARSAAGHRARSPVVSAAARADRVARRRPHPRRRPRLAGSRPARRQRPGTILSAVGPYHGRP